MKTTSKISALLVAIALVFSLAAPKPARASDAGEITLYVIGGLAVFVAFVFIGTVLTRDDSRMFIDEPKPEGEEQDQGVHMGLDCKKPDGTPALLCW